MVSKFSYWSGKELNMRGRIPWVYARADSADLRDHLLSPVSLFALFGMYAASAPLYWVWRKLTRKKRTPGQHRRPVLIRVVWGGGCR